MIIRQKVDKSSPLVSVVIPAYNHPQWVSSSLRSVLSQTYNNIEVLLIDDGSNENIYNPCEISDKRVYYYKNENHGVAYSRNFGIRAARGKYIAFIDSDDIWESNKLELQIRAMEETGAKWSQHSYHYFDDESGKVMKLVNTYPYRYRTASFQFCSFRVQTSCFVVDRECVLENGFCFDESKTFGEDAAFYIMFMRRGYPLLCIDRNLSGFRIHGTNAGKDVYKQIKSRAMCWEESRDDDFFKRNATLISKIAYLYCYKVDKFMEKHSIHKASVKGMLYAPAWMLFRIEAKRLENCQRGGVSVIMPLYNVEDYILDCVKSIVSQTYENIELIIVDDGSKDESVHIAEKFLNISGINYKIITQKNKGLSSARNTGEKEANGDYICYIDADDTIAPRHIEQLVCCLRENNLDFAFSDFISVKYDVIKKMRNFPAVNNTGKRNIVGSVSVDKMVDTADFEILNSSKLQKGFLERSIKIHCCAIMLRKSYLESENLLFDERLRFGEDVEFLWRILTKIENAGYIKDKTYQYLNRPGSLMNAQKSEQIYTFKNVFYESVCTMNIEEYKKKLIFARVMLGVLHSFAKHSKYNIFKQLRDIMVEREFLKRLEYINELNDIRWNIMEIMYRHAPFGFFLASKFF